MYNPDVANKMVEALDALRDACKRYAEFTEGEKKNFRHFVYQRTGQYGKCFIKHCMDEFMKDPSFILELIIEGDPASFFGSLPTEFHYDVLNSGKYLNGSTRYEIKVSKYKEALAVFTDAAIRTETTLTINKT